VKVKTKLSVGENNKCIYFLVSSFRSAKSINFNELRSRSWSHVFVTEAGVKKVTPITSATNLNQLNASWPQRNCKVTDWYIAQEEILDQTGPC